jgi:CubicO group peptidase (beta-lactamase class C family)
MTSDRPPDWGIADWQTAPATRWTFHHLREVVPTAQVFRSVSKSIVGCVVGILADRGALDTDDLATRHVPELKVSGYVGARIRDLLDMRSGVRQTAYARAFGTLYTVLYRPQLGYVDYLWPDSS